LHAASAGRRRQPLCHAHSGPLYARGYAAYLWPGLGRPGSQTDDGCGDALPRRRNSISNAQERAALQRTRRAPNASCARARYKYWSGQRGQCVQPLALRMVASRELRCSRHAEDSSYASPSQAGAILSLHGAALSWKGPETADVYLSTLMQTTGARLSGASCIYVGSQVSVRRRPAALDERHAACPFGPGADAVALVGHWGCGASGRMVRGNDELSSLSYAATRR
jgi:hypothetical protein